MCSLIFVFLEISSPVVIKLLILLVFLYCFFVTIGKWMLKSSLNVLQKCAKLSLTSFDCRESRQEKFLSAFLNWFVELSFIVLALEGGG